MSRLGMRMRPPDDDESNDRDSQPSADLTDFFSEISKLEEILQQSK